MSTKNLLIDWIAKPTDQTLIQIPRALVASAVAAALDFGLLILLVEIAGWSPLAAATVSYLAGGVVQYVLCSLWVFPAAPEKAGTGFLAFTVLSLVGLGLTWVTMAVLHDWAHVNYAIAKVAALGLAFSWNFFSRKLLLFKEKEPS